MLRVEDTDEKRYRREWLEAIYESLRWLGLDWDEGEGMGGAYAPYLQSARDARHREVARELLARGLATPDLGAPELVKVELARPLEPALRLRVDPSREFVVDDKIRGRVVFPPGSLGDFVITKTGGSPLYNFAAAIDDHDMAITHVIRGEEHLSNTPKQLLVYEAMGWTPPVYAHLPIILNERRAKLSKRDGGALVSDYEKMGILPDALFNFLTLLGWSPGGNREILSRDELIAQFDLDRVVKHPAVFDLAKLKWLNGEYMKKAAPLQLAVEIQRLLGTPKRDDERARLERVADLLKDRVTTLGDLIEQGGYLLHAGAIEPTSEALAKHCAEPGSIERLRQLREALAALASFDDAAIESAIRGLAERNGAKAAAYIHPLRVALTGQSVSPGIFDVTRLVGKETALRRIDDLIGRLQRQPASDVGVTT